MFQLVPPCQQCGLRRPSTALICSVMSPTTAIHHLGTARGQYDPALTDLLRKEWTGKSRPFPHTRNLNWQFVGGSFFFCTIAQYHKGRRQIKDDTPDYSLHSRDHLEITVLDPPVLGTRTTLLSHCCPGMQSKNPSMDERRKLKALETPAAFVQPIIVQCQERVDEETSRFPQVFWWRSSIHQHTQVLQL